LKPKEPKGSQKKTEETNRNKEEVKKQKETKGNKRK
jgi:hypothetical protein